MAKPTVEIPCESRQDIASPEIGRQVIEALCADPKTTPEYLDWAEPIKEPFKGVDDFVANWWGKTSIMKVSGQPEREVYEGLLWKRRRTPAHWGQVEFGSKEDRVKGMPAQVSLTSKWDNKANFLPILRSWASATQSRFGLLHVFTEVETRGKSYDRDHAHFEMGFFDGPNHPAIPNIGWAMYYGEEAAQLIDFEVIEQAGFPTERIGKAYLVRVTESIDDVVNDFPTFSRRRAELKALFPKDFFRVKAEPLIDMNNDDSALIS